MDDTHALPAELTIYTVGEVYPKALAWMAAGEAAAAPADDMLDTLSLDASGVHEVDGAGVQLLISLSNSLARQGRTLALSDPAAPLVTACTLLGATELLGAGVQGVTA
jgi:ABC-type transporter Mla MlaB component